MEAEAGRCGVCLAGGSPYTCPRCRLRYCSSRCFGLHGACAQDFQRRQLRLRLQGLREDPASRRRLGEALLRLRGLREAGDEEPLLGLDPCAEPPEAEELWARLSPEQRAAFQRLLGSGGASALLPPWRPWWAGGDGGAALVQELETPSEGDEPPLRQEDPPDPQERPTDPQERPTDHQERPTDHQERPTDPLRPWEASSPVPAVPSPLPPLGTLSRLPASPLLRFQLPNVLFAYAYASALYQGEGGQPELLPEFCGTVLDVSGALGARQVFRSTAEALQAALHALTLARYPECALGNAGVMLAVAQILMGAGRARQKGYSLAALAHLSRLLGRARRLMPGEDRAKVYGAKKKCDFLLSWVNENEEALLVLAVEVQQEYKTHRDTAREVGVVAQELEKLWGAKVPPPTKPLIEELDQKPDS